MATFESNEKFLQDVSQTLPRKTKCCSYYIYDMRWKSGKNVGAKMKSALLKVHLENNSSEIVPADQLRFGNEGIRSSAKSLLQRPTTRWPSSQPHACALTASNSVLLWSINTWTKYLKLFQCLEFNFIFIEMLLLGCISIW